MTQRSVWRKAWALLDARERRNAVIVLAMMVVSALSSALMVGSVMPFLSVLANPGRIEEVAALDWLYTRLGFDSAHGFLVALGSGVLLVIVVASVIQVAHAYLVARFSMMRMHSLSCRVMGAYLRQPYEFFLTSHSGDMGTQILSETQLLVNQFLRPAASLLAALLTTAAILCLLLWVNAAITVMCVLVLGGIYGSVYALGRRVQGRLGEARARENKARYRIAAEAFGGIKDVKLLGREASYLERYKRPSAAMAWTMILSSAVAEIPRYVLHGVALGGVIVLCLVLLDPQEIDSGRALENILPILGVFAFAGQRLIPELQKIYQSIMQMHYGKAIVDSVHADLFGKGSVPALAGGAPGRLGLAHELRLEKVSYTYPDAERPGLHEISLSIGAGEKIGVVGSTGAGKTTLGDVILGLLRPSSGEIVVDGARLDDRLLRAWQRSIGYVPQEIFLVDASVAENIALGIPAEDIDRRRVARAARIARLDAFVETELPQGYDTAVGERGVRLSGGQRQRIGIARALYHDPDLIVFDEATSALDNLTERELISALEALPGNKTIVTIAHRLSTVRACDRIAVLDQGRLVGLGGWDELLAENAAFRRIAKTLEPTDARRGRMELSGQP